MASSSHGSQAGIAPLGDASLTEKTQRPEAPSQLAVTNVRTGTHERFDRVVFDLAGTGKPGWYANYISAPTQQISGTPVAVNGEAFLSINIDGTVPAAEIGLDDPQLNNVAGSGSVIEVAKASTGSGTSQFIIGLQEERPYSIEVMQDPLRLVVDVRTD